MATPPTSAKPDLSALRIDDRHRSQSKMGKRIFYASIPVLIFAGIVMGGLPPAIRAARRPVALALRAL